MKNKDWERGRGRGRGRGGLINFPHLKKGGGLFERGGLNRGFTVLVIDCTFHLTIVRTHLIKLMIPE